MTRLRLVADAAIAEVAAAFAPYAEVRLVPGSHICRDDLRHADALLVRTVTRVDAALLAGTPVQFVGSATIGTDHVAVSELVRSGICFAHAPGCNADAVADYVIASIAACQPNNIDLDLTGLCVGVLGYGNVGRRVVQRLRALGAVCLVNDPPLQDEGCDDELHDLNEVLAQSDVVSVHVPLTHDGAYPSFKLIDQSFIARLRPHAMLVNSSRGAVLDAAVLLASRKPLDLVLDVWPDEPHLDQSLLDRTQLATPHIAGYSLEGKLRATAMLLTAFARYFDCGVDWMWQQYLPPAPLVMPTLGLRDSVLRAYDPRADDALLRELAKQPLVSRAVYFENLRRHYALRREFAFHRLSDQLLVLDRYRDAGFAQADSVATVL